MRIASDLLAGATRSAATLLAAATIFASPLLCQQQPAADLIVTNARIYTVDNARPVVDAMVIRAGRVAYIGDTRGAMTLAGAGIRVLDMGGRTIIPGMVDAHGHVAGLGSALSIVDLTGASSYDEIIARVAAKAKTVQPGTWITGRGWDQNRWGDTRFPTHDKLTIAVPNNPVWLTRVDGHAGLANKTRRQSIRPTVLKGMAGVLSSHKAPGQAITKCEDGFHGIFLHLPICIIDLYISTFRRRSCCMGLSLPFFLTFKAFW